MADPHLDTLASILCTYSLEIGRGDLAMVEAPAVVRPFLVAVTRELTALGAHPLVRPHLESVRTTVLEHGSAEQLTAVTALDENELVYPTRYLAVWAETNTRATSGVPAANMAMSRAARGPLHQRFFQRIAAGEARWCGVTLPTDALAQEAGMSFDDYERFVYEACRLYDPDPIAAWRARSARQAALVDRLEGTRRLRIVAEDTDLTLDVAGRTWRNADGHENFPDGEVYTSPVEGGTRGHISFSFDAPYLGTAVGGVRLWFEDGRVVREEARRGLEFLRQMLAMDDGARRVGEVAFGLNEQITFATGNTAFDEKIDGTCHIALGMAFPEAGGVNQSGLHWDMVCDLREGGEVHADGELVARNGRFL